MTKAKARERAKANAAKKIQQKKVGVEHPGQDPRAGHFNPGSQSFKGPGMNTNTRSFSGAKRGAARAK